MIEFVLCFSSSQVPKAKDEVVEREFNRLLEACSYLAQTLDEDVNGKKQPYSLGDTLEQLIRAQEKAVREKYLQHLREISKMKDSLRTILTSVGSLLTDDTNISLTILFRCVIFEQNVSVSIKNIPMFYKYPIMPMFSKNLSFVM